MKDNKKVKAIPIVKEIKIDNKGKLALTTSKILVKI